MTEFEYIVGLHTIVLGLATAKVLTTLSDTLKHRMRIRAFWVHSLWCVIVQLNIIGYWYALWRLHSETREFGFVEFLGFFSVSIALYLVSSFLSFDTADDGEIDLEDHFYKVRVPALLSFLYIFAFFVVLETFFYNLTQEANTTGFVVLDLVNNFALPTLVILGILLKDRRAQQAIVLLYAVSYIGIELNQASIGGT